MAPPPIFLSALRLEKKEPSRNQRENLHSEHLEGLEGMTTEQSSGFQGQKNTQRLPPITGVQETQEVSRSTDVTGV